MLIPLLYSLSMLRIVGVVLGGAGLLCARSPAPGLGGPGVIVAGGLAL